MAAITPTVQKVTNGLRGIVKSIIENRKTKARSAETATEDLREVNESQEASSQVDSTPAPRKATSRSASHSKVSAKAGKKASTGSTEKKSARKGNVKSASATAPKSKTAAASSKNETSAAPNTAVIPGMNQDPAHKPGHQKMNLKAQFTEKTGKKGKSQNSKAMNYMSGSDKVHRTTSPHRRIINGAGTLGAKAPQGRSRKAH